MVVNNFLRILLRVRLAVAKSRDGNTSASFSSYVAAV